MPGEDDVGGEGVIREGWYGRGCLSACMGV